MRGRTRRRCGRCLGRRGRAALVPSAQRLSPATRDLIRQLPHTRTFADWWRSNRDIQRILDQIENAKEALAIPYIMPFGVAPAEKVRTMVRLTIHSLLSQVPVEELPFFDESVRRSWEYGGPWHNLDSRELGSIGTNSDADRTYLALLTCHRNGYVREAAVRILGAHPSGTIIPFALIRLTDWVGNVADVAEAELRRKLEARHAESFVNCLGLIQRLEGNSRFRGDVSNRIVELLTQPDCAESVQRGFKASSRNSRRRSFEFALENPNLSVRQIIKEAISDRDVLIRKWAIGAGLARFANEEANQLLRNAVGDPYGPIRRMVFDATARQAPLSLNDLAPFLLDRSAMIRSECQSLVSGHFEDAVAERYRSVIQSTEARRAEIADLGLAETGTHGDAILITGMLQSRSARVRRAAIRGLRVLGIGGNQATLLRLVATDVPTVAREAASHLLKGRDVACATVWREALRNGNYRVPRAVLKLLRYAPKWEQLKIYLQAAASANIEISKCSIARLGGWLHEFNMSFAQPTTQDAESLVQLFESSQVRMPETLNRELRFLLQTHSRQAADS